jgi:hypothetical protein
MALNLNLKISSNLNLKHLVDKFLNSKLTNKFKSEENLRFNFIHKLIR